MTSRRLRAGLAATAALALAAALPSELAAGAWTMPQGTGQAITTITGYQADSDFDSAGNRVGDGEFRKGELSTYLEYGLRDDLTLGGEARLQHLEVAGGESARTTGLADLDLFARQRLWHDGFRALSAQGLAVLPTGYDEDRVPTLGSGTLDLEGRLLYGHGFALAGHQAYINVEGGYRLRFGDPADEIRLDATFGIRPAEGWLGLLQSFNTIGMRNEDSDASGRRGPDYDVYKLQVSVVRDLASAVSLQFGGYTEFAGRNAGEGNALFVALWTRF